MNIKNTHLIVVLFLFIGGCADAPDQEELSEPEVHIAETISTDEWNADLVAGEPTVDIGIYLPQTDDERYNSRVPVDTLMARFAYAKEIFHGVGVQLNILWIKNYVVPDTSWLTIEANRMQEEPGDDAPENMYDRMGVQKSALTPEAERVLEAIIEPDKRNDRTVYVVGLRDVHMAFYEMNEEGECDVSPKN